MATPLSILRNHLRWLLLDGLQEVWPGHKKHIYMYFLCYNQSRGDGKLWGDKALEGQTIACEQWLALPMLCLLRAFRHPWIRELQLYVQTFSQRGVWVYFGHPITDFGHPNIPIFCVSMQWDEKEFDTQFTPKVYFWTPNSEIVA